MAETGSFIIHINHVTLRNQIQCSDNIAFKSPSHMHRIHFLLLHNSSSGKCILDIIRKTIYLKWVSNVIYYLLLEIPKSDMNEFFGEYVFMFRNFFWMWSSAPKVMSRVHPLWRKNSLPFQLILAEMLANTYNWVLQGLCASVFLEWIFGINLYVR